MTKGVADIHPVGCIQVLVFLYAPRSTVFSALWGELEFLLRSRLKTSIEDSVRMQTEQGRSRGQTGSDETLDLLIL